jgi:hypothetical protein
MTMKKWNGPKREWLGLRKAKIAMVNQREILNLKTIVDG